MPERHDHDRERTLRDGTHPRAAAPGVCRRSRAGHDGGGRTGGTPLACTRGSAAVLRRNGSRPQSRAGPSARWVLTTNRPPDACQPARLPCRSTSSPPQVSAGEGAFAVGRTPIWCSARGRGRVLSRAQDADRVTGERGEEHEIRGFMPRMAGPGRMVFTGHAAGSDAGWYS